MGLSTVEVSADPGDDYCRGYANNAVNQSRAARASRRCAHFIRELPARWSLHYIDHFHACLPLFGSGQNALEERARTADLNECTQQMSSPMAAKPQMSSLAAEPGEGYCRGYANAAVSQARAARAIQQCDHLIRELPARWSLSYDDHFHACLPLFGSGQNAAEWEARTADLNECRRQMSSPAAQGGDIAYCLGYANAAVNQSQAARTFDRCDHFIRDLPARWSLNYIDHFRSCLSLYGSGKNALDLEDQARIADLNQCIHQMSSPTAVEPPPPKGVAPPPG